MIGRLRFDALVQVNNQYQCPGKWRMHTAIGSAAKTITLLQIIP